MPKIRNSILPKNKKCLFSLNAGVVEKLRQYVLKRKISDASVNTSHIVEKAIEFYINRHPIPAQKGQT